jgi:HlyD family secretion protein
MNRVPIARIVAALIAALCFAVIVRAVRAGPPNVPLEKDVKKAQREAKPNGQGADARAPLPNQPVVAGNGVVEPAQRETKISSQVPGLIARVAVEEGQRLERDAVLVELESGPERATLASAEAELGSAQAEYTRALHGQRAEDIEAAAADAAAAKAKSELSDQSLARTEALAKTGAATPDELDRARSAAANDAALFKSADARRRLAVAGSRYEDIMVAKAKVVAAQAKRDEAKARLDRLTVRAPYAGEVLQIKYRVGEYYQPQTDPLMTYGDTSRLRVRMDVDERDIAKVRLGQAAYAAADAFPGRKFTAKVSEIGRRMGRKNVRTDDPVERVDTKILEVVLDLEQGQDLPPGLRVTAYVLE